MTKKEILKILDRILDPDLRNRSIVEMGFVEERDIIIHQGEIQVSYTVGSPLAPTAPRWGLSFIIR
jgi:metal-sulfur cluster biosynthetic enzyme